MKWVRKISHSGRARNISPGLSALLILSSASLGHLAHLSPKQSPGSRVRRKSPCSCDAYSIGMNEALRSGVRAAGLSCCRYRPGRWRGTASDQLARRQAFTITHAATALLAGSHLGTSYRQMALDACAARYIATARRE